MHAYMIIAHNQFDLLEKLVKSLDDNRNDIYIHIDAKVKNFDFDRIKNAVKFSSVYFTDRIRITWGDFSQVKCEMILLKTAVENQNNGKQYEYFHLISGVDLPIKSNDYIHSFFENNKGKEFIHFTNAKDDTQAQNRIRYYHIFRKRRNLFFKILAQITYRIQMLLDVNRLKGKDLIIQKGCNWFSITNNLAEYIVDNLNFYEKLFKYSYCADEVFVQTVLKNSPFKNNLYMPQSGDNHLACMRLIDWKRGNPYVFKDNSDFDMIKESPAVFARKFDYERYPEIIDSVLEYRELA